MHQTKKLNFSTKKGRKYNPRLDANSDGKIVTHSDKLSNFHITVFYMYKMNL